MGLSDVIAAGITLITLMVAGYLIIAGINGSADAATASLAAVRDTADARLHTSLTIDVGHAGLEYIDFNLTNIGKTPIDNLAELDLFVKTIEDGRVTGCRWLPFQDGPAGDGEYWYVADRHGAFPTDPYSLKPGETIIARVVCPSPVGSGGVLEVSATGSGSVAGYFLIMDG